MATLPLTPSAQAKILRALADRIERDGEPLPAELAGRIAEVATRERIRTAIRDVASAHPEILAKLAK